MTTVYLAGPMRGLPNFNFQAFEDAAHDLADMGYKVISPHQFDLDTHRVVAEFHIEDPPQADGESRRVFDKVELSPDFDIDATLKDDLDLIESLCDAIVLLPGWSNSEGANMELTKAEALGYPVLYFDPTVPLLTRLDA